MNVVVLHKVFLCDKKTTSEDNKKFQESMDTSKRPGRPPIPKEQQMRRVHFRMRPAKIALLRKWQERNKLPCASTAYQRIVDTHPDIQAIEEGEHDDN